MTDLQPGDRFIFTYNAETARYADGDVIRVAKNGSVKIARWRNLMGKVNPVWCKEWVPGRMIQKWERRA